MLEFVEFAASATDRLVNQYRKTLKNDQEIAAMPQSGKLAFDLLQFAELYQAYQPEYDMWDHKNIEQVNLFIEKFESRVYEFDSMMDKIGRGEDPY